MDYFLIYKRPGCLAEVVMYPDREGVERALAGLPGLAPAIGRDNAPIWVIADNEYVVLWGELEKAW